MKYIFLIFNLLFSLITLEGQLHTVSDYALIDMNQHINPINELVTSVFNNAEKRDYLNKTTLHERFCIYTHKYINQYQLRTRGKEDEIKTDIKRIFIDHVGFTNEEYNCLEKTVLGFHSIEGCAELLFDINCKINTYFYDNIDKIFDQTISDHFTSLKGKTIEVNFPGEDTYQIEYSPQGIRKSIIGPIGSKVLNAREYDSCGFLDTWSYYDENNKLTKILYSKTKNRNWDGRLNYYANGNTFSKFMDSGNGKFKKSYTLSPNGDTLTLLNFDFRGDISDFNYEMFTRDFDGNISSQNNNGQVIRYSKQVDSIFVLEVDERYYSSPFYILKDRFDLTTKEALSLDTIFLDQFEKNYQSDYQMCIDNYTQELYKTDKYKNSGLLPFVNTSCDMITNEFRKSRSRPSNYEFTKDELIHYYKEYEGNIQNKASLEQIYEYFELQANLSKGEWKYYSEIVNFVKDKMQSADLMNTYKQSLRSLTKVASAYYKTNDMYESNLRSLKKVVDTIGNRFLHTKSIMLNEFISSLSLEEKITLKEVSSLYQKATNLYLEDYIVKNKNICNGVDKNRLEYYRLIIKWQQRHPHKGIFNKINKEEVPSNFQSIIEKFDSYLSDKVYNTLNTSETQMLKSFKGFDIFRSTPFNPYFSKNKKRKKQLFNWLITPNL